MLVSQTIQDAVISESNHLPIAEMLRHIRHYGAFGPETTTLESQAMGDSRQPGVRSQGTPNITSLPRLHNHSVVSHVP